MNILNIIHRKPDKQHAPPYASGHGASDSRLPIRLSGTTVPREYSYQKNPKDGELGGNNPNGRTGNDWLYPDSPRGHFDVGIVNGDRLQDFANTHLSEGPAPGRIPRGWNNRSTGKLGRGVSGNPSGDDAFADTVSGTSAGGIADMKYVPHTPTPRNMTVARPYLRTVDDFASVPGVYVADATRR